MQQITPELVRTFSALSDPVRMATLARLADGPATVGELAEPFALSAAGFSKHLSILQSAGLVSKELDGRKHICSLQVAPLQAAFDWLSFYRQFWSSNLDQLEDFLVKSTTKDKEKKSDI
ncbi:metalloregulator ArsR/SmtB family transcription factor [uncultured Litoreibacter sp.]|uniref:ArsR/SmtB family transcription factor n=1 Tax=uncultured Litoreibacter sp. TaxID=1392394 RepID=UPI0026257574|nr:metalloregulator ArsR/SmtB family transcription factor [uncultured Litoreibacter sp.]